MANKNEPLAIAYDFDGTLAPGNMQEYDFIPAIGMKSDKFWEEAKRISKRHSADNILAYMHLMLKMALEKSVKVRMADFKNFGESVKLFEGVESWFGRINSYGKDKRVNIEHYIISSGIREMIYGTPIANNFKAIYASSFMYDHNGVAFWPALALNYTGKTQYLFRINKGSLEVSDDSKINAYIPKVDRPVPFENMIFIGDGDTDVPCMRLVKDQGGYSIAVYKPNTPRAKQKAAKLIKQERVYSIAPADYSENKELDVTVKAVIDKIAADAGLFRLGKAS